MNLKNTVSLLIRLFEPLFKKLFGGLLSLIYKENCIICGKTLDTEAFSPCLKTAPPLCKTCLNSVEILSPFAHSKISGVEIFSACFYDGNIKNLIHKLKFNHNLSAARVLGDILYRFYIKISENDCPLKDVVKHPKNVIVVPIPTNRKNISLRGYNNVLEIVKIFASNAGFRVSDNLLIKIKDTKPQFDLKRNARESNVKGCFGVNLKNYKGETVLLIDDIITTGYTLKEAVSTLQTAGVKNIFCITVSKGKN